MLSNTLPKFVFVHIVKTAGTSFRRNLLDTVYRKRYVIDNLYKSKLVWSKRGKKSSRKEWAPIIDLNVTVRPRNITENTDAIIGHFRHFKYDDLDWPYVTFVRDPVERIISAYFYYQKLFKDNIGIKDFAKIYPNHMSYVMGDDLTKFKFIGITEKFDESLVKFCKVFNIPWKKRITKRQRVNINYKGKVSLKDIDYLKGLNEKDYELYNKALKL